ncbi:MAG: hypothetical protein FWF31_02805 [Desulfobulbus sp.]|nr:hypothetical protein [Desulfobulbus sp.]
MAEMNQEKMCFVIMPIKDAAGYGPGHFTHVYSNIIVPACAMAGYSAVRSDEGYYGSLINLGVINKIIEAPVVICDLSTLDSKVLYELGIRQAFGRPVVLMQESGTPRLFDISRFRYVEYSREMRYHEVPQTQKELREAIELSIAASGQAESVNSIVRTLGIVPPATPQQLEEAKEVLLLDILHEEMREMRAMLEKVAKSAAPAEQREVDAEQRYQALSDSLEEILSKTNMGNEERSGKLTELSNDIRKMREAAASDDRGRWQLLLNKTRLAIAKNMGDAKTGDTTALKQMEKA